MLRKITFIIFAAIVLQLAVSSGVAAQVPDSCLGKTIWYWPDPIPIGYFIFSPFGQGPYSYYIAAMGALCPPVNAQKETCPTCPSATKPISLATGNTFIEQTD